MPIFVYKCQDCGKTFERLENMDSPEKTVHICCEDDGYTEGSVIGIAERIPAVSSFRLKGPGFFANDYPKNPR